MHFYAGTLTGTGTGTGTKKWLETHCYASSQIFISKTLIQYCLAITCAQPSR